MFEHLGKPSVKILSIAIEQGFFSSNNPYIKHVIDEALKVATFEDFKNILKLIQLSDFRNELYFLYKEYSIEYVCSVINDWAKSENILNDIYHIEELDFNDIHIYIESILKDLKDDFEYDEKDFETIAEFIDIDDIIYSNVERDEDNQRRNEKYIETRNLDDIINTITDPIDDLFRRS